MLSTWKKSRSFTKLLCLPSGREQIQSPRPNKLGGLVVELLLSIADFLSSEDTYCLSLCNHRLFATFESWRDRKQLENESRLSFLSRPARDDRHYFTCYVCYVLHRFDCGSKSFGLLGPSNQQMSQSKLPCARMGDWQSIPELTMCIHSKENYYYTHHTFCFLHLQLAMRRYYYSSRCGLSASSLSFTEVNRYIASTALCSLEARVCRDLLPALCLRIQNIMSVSGLAKRLLSDKDRQVPPQIYQICAHIGSADLLLSINKFVDAHHKRETLSLLRTTCDKCNTEYQLELRVYGKRNIALMITRWINFGTGRSPDDPQWKVHSLASQHAPPILRPSDMMASPRLLFEDSTTRTFEELCTQNLHYLTGRTYESEMTRLSGSLPSWEFRPVSFPDPDSTQSPARVLTTFEAHGQILDSHLRYHQRNDLEWIKSGKSKAACKWAVTPSWLNFCYHLPPPQCHPLVLQCHRDWQYGG